MGPWALLLRWLIPPDWAGDWSPAGAWDRRWRGAALAAHRPPGQRVGGDLAASAEGYGRMGTALMTPPW